MDDSLPKVLAFSSLLQIEEYSHMYVHLVVKLENELQYDLCACQLTHSLLLFLNVILPSIRANNAYMLV